MTTDDFKKFPVLEDAYVLVMWPESQMFMEEDWFHEEAILENEGNFGSAAYFIPLKYILDERA
jgi:hypothetical protein